MTPSILARLYLRAERARHALSLAIDGLWTGLWLGMLRPADLHAVDEAFYAARPSYRGAGHNHRGLFDWEAHALAKHFPSSGTLRIIGAGGGREVLALAKRGYVVDAWECNPALADAANGFIAEAGLHASVQHLPRDAAPPNAAPCNGVIVGWSTYMLIAGRNRRIRFLEALRPGMRPGTPLLLSFFTRSGAERRVRFVAAVANVVRRARLAPRAEIGDDLSPIYVHRFTKDELDAELREAGFRLVEYRDQGQGPYESGFAVAVS